ncbi:MAG: TRAP transporter small permease [Succinivibrionaceae bacterium]|nr:TRAP transporter small permease [Succinivibrionaceae bacterium]
MEREKILGNLDLVAAGVAFVILICVTFGGVIMRYIVGHPIMWAEEVQLWSFLWITFLGAGAAFRYGSHVAVEIVYELLPRGVKRGIDYLNFAIITLVLLYLMLKGVDMLQLMIKAGRRTQIFEVPLWFINLALPAGCLLMMVSNAFNFYKNVVKAPAAPAEAQKEAE